MGKQEAYRLWRQVCADLSTRSETNNPMAEEFLLSLVPQDLDDTTLTLLTGFRFAKQWVEARYLSFIKETVFNILGSTRNIQINVSTRMQEPSELSPEDLLEEKSETKSPSSEPPPNSGSDDVFAPINKTNSPVMDPKVAKRIRATISATVDIEIAEHEIKPQ